MSFSSLLINLHLLLSIYALFIFWKDNVFSKGTTIETVKNYYQTTGVRRSVIWIMLTLCMLPILNLVTLYRLIITEMEVIIDNLVRRHLQQMSPDINTDSRLGAIYQHRSVLLAWLNCARSEEETVELMRQIKACNQELAKGEKQVDYGPLKHNNIDYPKHLSRLDESIGNVNLSLHSQNGACYSFFICVNYQPVFESGYIYKSWKHAQSEGRRKIKEFTLSTTTYSC